MSGREEDRPEGAASGLKIGLALSGGGGKGAYHLGVFRALEEAGLAGHLSAISGCSIGAYMGLLYSSGGISAARELLYRFPLLSAAEKVPGCTTKYSSRGLRDYLLAAVPEEGLWRRRHLYACAYSLEAERPAYFRLDTCPVSRAADYVTASGSLPELFPPVEIDGCRYTDGGVVPAVCLAPAPPDKIPIRPLAGERLNIVISVFLKPTDRVDRALLVREVQYLEIRPSVPLEPYPSAGTLDFDPGHLAERESLGYRDAVKDLSTLLLNSREAQ